MTKANQITGIEFQGELMKPANRMSALKPFFFTSLNERLKILRTEGRDIIRLDMGSPDLPPGEHIIRALEESARKPGSHGYQAHTGPQHLRQAWADWYFDHYHVQLDPESQILPLMGSKEGIFHISQAYLDPGEVVVTIAPCYGTYIRSAQFAGADVYYVRADAADGFLPDFAAVPEDIWRRAKLLWMNYPNNPTGASAPLSLFEQAIAIAREHDLIVCQDAAYSQLFFHSQQPPSLLQVPNASEVAVEFNTLSKSHHMAGWRSAALLGNPNVVNTLLKLKSNVDSSHFLPILEASVAALKGDQSWLDDRNAILRLRRDVVVQGLREIGLQPFVPDAAFYVWTPIPAGWDCEEFADAVLENTGVSLTPGTVFGPAGEGFIRIALTVPEARIKVAMDRIKEWLGRL